VSRSNDCAKACIGRGCDIAGCVQEFGCERTGYEITIDSKAAVDDCKYAIGLIKVGPSSQKSVSCCCAGCGEPEEGPRPTLP